MRLRPRQRLANNTCAMDCAASERTGDSSSADEALSAREKTLMYDFPSRYSCSWLTAEVELTAVCDALAPLCLLPAGARCERL